jgi:WD repeat and FYVE domain-containing protein 3
MLSMLALVFANRLLIILMVNRLVETHIFSFVVGRAFVTDIEKLKISSKTRSLDVAQVLKFFSEVTKVCL